MIITCLTSVCMRSHSNLGFELTWFPSPLTVRNTGGGGGGGVGDRERRRGLIFLYHFLSR